MCVLSLSCPILHQHASLRTPNKMLSLLTSSTSYVVQSPGMMTPATCTSRTAAPTMFWGQLAQADIVGIDARKQPAPLMRSNAVVVTVGNLSIVAVVSMGMNGLKVRQLRYLLATTDKKGNLYWFSID